MQFLGLFDAAVGPFGREPRFLRWQSAALEVFLQQCEVRFDFARQLALGRVSAEQIH